MFLVGVLWARRADQRSALARGLGSAAGVGTALLALFYLPFFLHPQFGATWTYLVERRIGGSFPYNNLADVFTRTTIYNSTYYVAFLSALTIIALVMLYRHSLGATWGSVAGAALIAGLALAVWQPGWLTVDGRDLTAAVFLLAFGAAWVLPRVPAEERMLWLWFGAPFVLTLFFIEKPRTHVYVFFTPWALLAGMVIERAWRQAWKRRAGRRAGADRGRGRGCHAGGGLRLLYLLAFRLHASGGPAHLAAELAGRLLDGLGHPR